MQKNAWPAVEEGKRKADNVHKGDAHEVLERAEVGYAVLGIIYADLDGNQPEALPGAEKKERKLCFITVSNHLQRG